MTPAHAHAGMSIIPAMSMPTGIFLVLLPLLAGPGAVAAEELLNHLKWTDRLESSGQPGEDQLDGLVSTQFDMVINLAPPQSEGSIGHEGGILGRNGLVYVNIPVDWKAPTPEDFRMFREVLSAGGDSRVLVHCQINMRGSAFSFLYRVVHDGADPDGAWETMTRVWVPRDQWLDLIMTVLRDAGLDWEP